MDAQHVSHRVALSPHPSGFARTVASKALTRYRIEPTGCWLFTGSRDRNGYGKVTVLVADGRTTSTNAHRAFFEVLRGPIPPGLHLDHLCRNPGCVNPDHMEAVTSGENTRRGWAASRPTCPHGHLFTPENTIWVTSKTGDTKTRRCRTCNRERNTVHKRKWRAHNKDKVREINQRYYAAHREEIIRTEVERKRRKRAK